MRIIKLFLISVCSFAVLIFLISLLLPSRALIERSGVIDAPLTVVYSQLNDLKGWPRWNPWAAPEAAQQLQFSTPAAGTGAYFTWMGERVQQRVSGRVTLTDSDPQRGVHYRMDISDMKPVEAVFNLKTAADGKGTAILWRLETHLGWQPWWKIRGFLADRLTGPQLEEGLTRLKAICEQQHP